MNDSLKSLKEMTRSQLMLAFIILSGLIAPGAATLWVFDPTFIYEKEVSKIILLSFVLTSAPAFFNFVVITVFGLMKGHPRNTQRISTEFTFALMAVALAYFIMVLISIICELSVVFFALGALVINIIAVITFVRLMDSPDEQST